jgi:DNA-binding transcriptional LysR family regulator
MDFDQLQRRLRLRDLETLAAVVKAGGMRKAAHVLHLSQPAVSRAIRDLEQTLGVQLLQRGRRGVEPTSFGEALVRRSTGVFDELQGALRELAYLADPSSGEVRLGAIETLHAGLVGTAVERLSREHPRMRFVLESGQAPELVNDFLRQRLVDFVMLRPLALPLPSDIEGEPLFHDRLRIVVGPRHRLARKRRLVLADLAQEPWILSRNELKPESPVSEAFASAGLPMPERVVTSSSLHTRFTLLNSGAYVTVVPHSLVPFGDHRTRLHIVPVALAVWKTPIMVLTLRGRTLGPTAHLFLETVRELSPRWRESS